MGFGTATLEDLNTAFGPIGAQALVEEFGGRELLLAPTFSMTVGAAFGQENLFVNIFRALDAPSFQEDPNFQFTDDMLPEDLQVFSKKFEGVSSQAEFDFRVRRAREELRRRKILAASGTGSTLAAYALAGIVSPENLLPFGAGFRAARLGKGILEAAVVGGATALSEQVVAEITLQQHQTTRANRESAQNITGALIMGSVLGSAGGLLGKARRATIQEMTTITASARKADDDFFRILETRIAENGGRALDDAEIQRIINEDIIAQDPVLQRMVGTGNESWIRRFATRMVSLSPGIRGRVSESTAMRIATSNLTGGGLVSRKNARALRPSVEAEVALVQYRGQSVLLDVDEVYRRYAKETDRLGVQKMSREDFYHNVVRAARRETPEPSGNSKWIPPEKGSTDLQVVYRNLDVSDSVAVKALQSAVSRFRKFQNELLELGNELSGHLTIDELQPNSVQRTATSYVHRVYNLTAIRDRRSEFLEVLRQGIRAVDETADINEDELLSIIHKLEDSSDPSGQLSMSSALGEKRTLLIPDTFVATLEDERRVAFEEFLENELATLLGKQIHVFAPRMVFARRFASPVHQRVLALRGRWHQTMETLNQATDAELPRVANEVDKLAREMNDIGYLEAAHGQGTREWAERANQYMSVAETRDRLMDELIDLDDQLDRAIAESQVMDEQLDRRLEIDREILRAIDEKKDGPLAPVIEIVNEVQQGSRVGKARQQRILAMEEQLSDAEAKARELEQEAARLDERVATDKTILGLQKGIEDNEELIRRLESRVSRVVLRGRTPKKATLRSVDKIKKLKEEIEFNKRLLEVRQAEVGSGLNQLKARAARARQAADIMRSELERIRKETPFDPIATAKEVIARALEADRVRGNLEVAYRFVRKAIKSNPDLQQLAQKAKEFPVSRLEEARIRSNTARENILAANTALEQTRQDLAATQGALISMRRLAKNEIRKEDTARFSAGEPKRVMVRASTSMETVRTRLANRMSKLFDKTAEIRGRAAQEAEELKWLRRKIKDEYAQLKEAAEARGDLAEVRRLAHRENRDLLDLDFMRRSLFGVGTKEKENLGLAASRIIRSYNFVTFMGGMMLSSIPDMAMVMFTAGFLPWARMMIQAFRKGFSLRKLSQHDLARLLIASDTTLGSLRLSRIGDIGDVLGATGKIEGFFGKAAVKMSRWSGMERWNATWRGLASVSIAQRTNEIVRAARLGKASKAEQQFLELAGIDSNMAERINSQLDQWGHREKVAGFTFEDPNTSAWTDPGARELYEAAVIQTVNRTVIVPGVGDLPRAMDNGAIRLILQFRSFSIAASQQVLLSGAQRFFTSGDMAVVQGTLSLLAMGAFTEMVKTMVNQGPEEFGKLMDSPPRLAVNAIDRSGILGIFADANAAIERLTLGDVGLSAVFGDNDQRGVSRFSSRNLLATLAGPTLGQAESLAQLATTPFRIAHGRFSDSDLTNARRMFPFQSLWQVRLLLDDLAPRAVTGDRRPVERWFISDDDIEEINNEWARLFAQPALK